MYGQRLQGLLLAAALVASFSACAPKPPLIPTSQPTSVETTASYQALRNLPAPGKPVPVAVYSYPDLTGQLKASETIANNSRAVTQGAIWMLVKSLKDAGSGRWFKVIQRANLDNLLKERQIIRETRGKVSNQTGQQQPGLPSLLFAGVILEGGIIGYDSNTVTGGLGARYLGIGGDVQYRQDTVTVYLNAISSQTGEILKSVMTRKTVASYGVRGSVFKFVAFQKLLEGETGYTVNEPGQIAVAQAIEHAVRALIIEGALEGLWQFEDEIAGREETQLYLADKEDDLLLGDASSEVAQSLLTEEQLQKVAEAREARRKRLKTQAERKKQRELAAAETQTDQQRRPIAQTSAPSAMIPKSTLQPAVAKGASLTAEQLAAVGRRPQDGARKQMVSVKANEPRIKVQQHNAAKPVLVDMSALHAVLAEFNSETERLVRLPGLEPGENSEQPNRRAPTPDVEPLPARAMPIAADQTQRGNSDLSRQNGENL